MWNHIKVQKTSSVEPTMNWLVRQYNVNDRQQKKVSIIMKSVKNNKSTVIESVKNLQQNV